MARAGPSRPPAAPGLGGMRRYPVIGGTAAWRVPLLAAGLVAGAVAADAWGLAVTVAGLAWAAHRLWRSVVIEVSPDGLARGLVLGDAPVGPTVAMPWASVVDVHTTWCRPGSDLALETTVRGHDGATIRLSTAMGLSAYWRCLADIARRVPTTASSGLTVATLAAGPPTRGHVLAATRTAGALALILAAMVGVFYVWAQGRSSLSRDLDPAGAASSPLDPCSPGPRSGPSAADGLPPAPCR